MKKLYLGLILILCSCASIIDGTKQTLEIQTEPAGASCSVVRIKTNLGNVITPGYVQVERTKYDLTVVCHKDGYKDVTRILTSDSNGMTGVSVITTGIVGWGFDSATGADNKYNSPVVIKLNK